MSRLILSSKYLEKTSTEYTQLSTQPQQEDNDIFVYETNPHETTPLNESTPNYGVIQPPEESKKEKEEEEEESFLSFLKN